MGKIMIDIEDMYYKYMFCKVNFTDLKGEMFYIVEPEDNE